MVAWRSSVSRTVKLHNGTWGFIVRVLMDPADQVTILDTNRSQPALPYPAKFAFNRAPSAERLQNFWSACLTGLGEMGGWEGSSDRAGAVSLRRMARDDRGLPQANGRRARPCWRARQPVSGP